MNNVKWKIIKWILGPLSLYFDARLRGWKRQHRRPFDIWLLDSFMRCCLRRPDLETFSQPDHDRYKSVTAKTVYWHGTGRLQYDQDGQQIDVFERLLQEGGLRPARDVFDVTQGEMDSISVARQRMYARIYADMHVHRGAKLSQRYGSPRFWAYYFIMAINLHAIKELGLWRRKVRKQQQAVWREQGKNIWTVKVIQSGSQSVGRFFDQGSDISGNYPILIGLGEADHHFLKTAGYIERYERRIGSVIQISN